VRVQRANHSIIPVDSFNLNSDQATPFAFKNGP
jgi:hypothetical protein